MNDHTEAAPLATTPFETSSLAPPPAPEWPSSDLAGPPAVASGAPAAGAAGCAVGTETIAERPRARWAAIIWGGVLAGLAAVALWVTVSPDRRTALADWTVSLSAPAAAAYIALAIGAVVLVAGVAGILRRAQRALDRRRVSEGTSVRS